MTAKACVRTHNAGECTRASSRLGRCYGHETVVYRAATGDLPMQTKPPRSPRYKLILSRLHRVSDKDDGPARAFYTHAHTPLFSSRYFSTPIFILSLITLSPSLSLSLPSPSLNARAELIFKGSQTRSAILVYYIHAHKHP